MSAIELTLIGKPGCHLCDDARGVVLHALEVYAEDADSAEVTLAEKSILDDQALFDQFCEEIPVLMIDGRVHTYWRVDEARLLNALRER